MTRHLPFASNAVVKINTAIFRGRVHSCDAEQAVVGFVGSHPPMVALGAHVGLVLSGGRLVEAVRCDAEVRRRLEVDDGRRYALRFRASPFAEYAFTPPLPERRLWARVAPPIARPVVLFLQPTSKSGRVGPEIQGRLIDVGGGGLGVLLALATEDRLTGFDGARVTFRPPGRPITVVRRCHIRSRSLAGDGVRVGLQYTRTEDPTLAFEPLWDCERCGEKGILGLSHPFCGSCGARRQSPTYLPAWDDLVPASQHAYCGEGVHCVGCGAGWSVGRAFCALCGTDLPTAG